MERKNTFIQISNYYRQKYQTIIGKNINRYLNIPDIFQEMQSFRL